MNLTADIRSRASYLAPCCLCSFIGVDGQHDIIRYPSHRTVILPPTQRYPQGRTFFRLTACCFLSTTSEAFESEAATAAWWTARRLQTLACVADDNRRRNVLRKLAAAQLEPITAETSEIHEPTT